MDEISESVANRAFLKSNWDRLDEKAADMARKVPAPPQEKPFDSKAALIDLTRPEEMKIRGPSVVEAILRRQSRRKFSSAGLSLEELSFLLFATQGVRKRSAAYSFRTVPSGGARHPLETYVYADRIDGVPRGLYRYLPLEHRLLEERSFREGMDAELDEALNGQLYKAAAYFMWTATPYRTEWRYAEASAKLVALDAGHVCQNLYIVCEAIGCGTCGIGAYLQKPLDEFLGVDGKEEFAIYAAPVGKTR